VANASNGNAYIPGGGAGGGVGIAAGGATQTSGTVVFSNSNGVTFGYNNGTITATVTPGAAAGIAAIQASNTTYTSGTVVLSNANGLSFGSSAGGAITGSYTVPGATVFSNSNNVSFGLNGSTVTATANPGLSAVSAGTTSVAGGALVLSNSNGVSFGLNGSTITGSVAAQSVQTQNAVDVTLAGNTAGVLALVSSGTLSIAGGNNITLSQAGNAITISGANAGGAQTGISGLVVSNTTYTSGTVTFQNANGISFGSSGANGISASYTVPTQSNQTVGLYALGNTTQNSSTTLDARSLSFNGLGEVTVGYSNGSVQISAPPSSVGVSNIGNTAGNTGTYSGQIVFAGGNNITLSVSSAAGGAQTVTISGPAVGASVNFSAGTTSSNLNSVVFSNSNGVSFGLNASTITGSVAAQTNQSIGVYGISQTTGASSSSTYDARSLSFAGYGVISIGQSGGSIQISGPGTTNFANLSVSAGTTSNSLGSIVFSNSNGVSFGLNGSTITGSVATSLTNINVSAGTTSQNLSAITFSNSNGVSFGLNGSVMTASAAAGGGAAISAGTQSTNGGTVVFSNSNGISFGMSNSSVVTASYTVPTVTQVSSVGLYALGNTTQNSSTTLDQRTMSFNALGAMTMGYSNGSIQVSAPATSSLSGVGGINISVNGSTITISGPGQLSFLNALPQAVTTLTQIGNGSVQVYPFYSPEIFSASRADILISQSVSSSSNSSHAGAISVNLGLYTRNGSTLSLATSGSQSYQWTNTSNNSMGSLSGLRRLSVPMNVNFSAGGDMWVAVQSVTSSTNANWFTASNLALQPQMTAQLQGLIGAASNNTNQLVLGEGIWSTTSAALPASIAFSNLTGLGSAGAGNNVYMAPVYFANFTA
jgi:hypothetical protein